MKTLEERVADLEQELAAMKKRPWMTVRVEKNWQSTVGWASGSDLHDAAARAGEEYRREQTFEKEVEARGGVGY